MAKFKVSDEVMYHACAMLKARDEGDGCWPNREIPHSILTIRDSLGLEDDRSASWVLVCEQYIKRWAVYKLLELRAAIRTHRDERGDDRCWIDDQTLYAILGDGNLGDNTVGDPEAMRKNCDRFIANRCQAGGGWKSYKELEDEIAELKKRLAQAESRVEELDPRC